MEFILGEFIGKRTSKQKLEPRLTYERKYGLEGSPLAYKGFWQHMDDILPKVPLTRHMIRVYPCVLSYYIDILVFRSDICYYRIDIDRYRIHLHPN